MMPCPRLADLPSPPVGRTGWPWTEESGLGAAPAPPGGWPSITVVVPSYQQGEFLEETLRSVLLQGYPRLELLVMDGGSKDTSVEVIRRYERWIAGWVSERDGGQSAAINKGWRRSSGELVTWLNSDDLLLPGWAGEMARVMAGDQAIDLAFCDVQVVDRSSRPTWVYRGHVPSVEEMVLYWKTTFAQQGFLLRRRVLEACGYVDESLHFTMDTEYWLRLLVAGRKLTAVPRTLGAFRVHEAAKTSTQNHVHVDNMIDVTTHFCETAPPALSGVAAQARRRLYWNAAHVKYDGRSHADARNYALRHLQDGGWKVLPRVGAMVALSLLGGPGHRLLELSRRLRVHQ
jgi:glycosyltransferase involved in cell wall biosynthesis